MGVVTATALMSELSDEASHYALGDIGWDVRQWRTALRWSDLPPGARDLARLLAEYADWRLGRNVRPGQARLLEDSGRSKDTLQRWLRLLLSEGWLVLVKAGTSTGLAAEYALTVPTRVAWYAGNLADAYEGRVAARRRAAQPVDSERAQPVDSAASRDETGRFAAGNFVGESGKIPLAPPKDLPAKDSGDLPVPTVPSPGGAVPVEETRSEPVPVRECRVSLDSSPGGETGGVEPGAVDDAGRRRSARWRVPAVRRAAVRRTADRSARREGVPRRPLPGVRPRVVRAGRPGRSPERGDVPPAPGSGPPEAA